MVGNDKLPLLKRCYQSRVDGKVSIIIVHRSVNCSKKVSGNFVLALSVQENSYLIIKGATLSTPRNIGLSGIQSSNSPNYTR